MALSDYQFSYRGVTLGDSTSYDILEVSGLFDQATKAADRDNVRSHGVIPGRHTGGVTSVKVKLEVNKGVLSDAAYATAFDDILAATNPDQYPLADETNDKFVFRFPGWTQDRFVLARPHRRKVVRRSDTEFGLLPVEFELKRYSPLILEDNLQSTATITTGNSPIFATNSGDADTYCILNCDPNASGDFKITNDTNGDVAEFDNAGAAGALMLDMHRFAMGYTNQLIAYRSSTSYYANWLTPRNVFRLSPGSNSLTLNTGDGCVVSWRNAWM
ncbi:MAG: hypothetical protein ACW99J_18595 [Candidatus Thorarchaeota archaeon]|jgi:hypothetical protein